MSRSYRKPWAKDPRNSYMKKVAARIYRSHCRQISRVFTKHWIDPLWIAISEAEENKWCGLVFIDSWLGYDDPHYPHRRELINQWDVCDWRFRVRKIYYRGRKRGEDNMEGYLRACRK